MKSVIPTESCNRGTEKGNNYVIDEDCFSGGGKSVRKLRQQAKK